MEVRSSTGEKMATTSRPSSPPSMEEEMAAEKTTSEEEEQQQMERFYALVANVRALRAMFKEATLPSCRDDDVSEGGGEQRKKRPRAAPWRPAFEMADFECGGGGTTTDDIEAATTKGQDGNCKKKGKRSEANAAAEDDEGEVVEGKPVAVAIVADGPGKSTTMPD